MAGEIKNTKPEAITESDAGDFTQTYNVAAGLDIHKSVTVACLLGHNPKDRNAYEIKKFGPSKKNILELGSWLLQYGVKQVLIKSTGNYWREPTNMLQAAGVSVFLVSLWKVKGVLGPKTDDNESIWLATQARVGIFPKSQVVGKHLQELRELADMRENFVEDMTSIKVRVFNVLLEAGYDISQVVSDTFGETGMIVINGLMNRQSPLEILQNLEANPEYSLTAPRKTLVKALTGSMPILIQLQLNFLLTQIAALKTSIKFAEELFKNATMQRG